MNKQEFIDWMQREMPPGTVIGDPKWWAKRIYKQVEAAVREEQAGTQVELAWSDGKMTVIFVPQGTAPWATDLPNLLYRHAPDSAAEIARLREANAELLEGLKHARHILPADKWADDTKKLCDALIAKHGGK